MRDTIKEMLKWIHTYYDSGAYFIATLGAYFYIFCTSKDKRERLILPVCFLLFMLLNPILFKYVYNNTRYWRWFWMIPSIYVITDAFIDIIKKVKKRTLRVVASGAVVIGLAFYGTFFLRAHSFSATSNLYRINQETIDICEMMLEKSESPFCMSPTPLNYEVRQYSGEIRQYVGRNVDWRDVKTQTDLQRYIYFSISEDNPNYEVILKTAKEAKCQFVIVQAKLPISDEMLNKYGYKVYNNTPNYILYIGD